MQQILYNLATNAIYASPQGGTVNITAELADNDSVRITVLDQGPGIPEGLQERVFEPFFSANHGGGAPKEGLGLGLSIVKGIVESIQGRIQFESRVGRGTSFHVYLPAK